MCSECMLMTQVTTRSRCLWAKTWDSEMEEVRPTHSSFTLRWQNLDQLHVQCCYNHNIHSITATIYWDDGNRKWKLLYYNKGYIQDVLG